MKFLIHYSGRYEDEVEISGGTIEEIREIAFKESESRGWDTKDCWSEEV